MSEVTRILGAFEVGERHAAGELLPLVYDELRGLAAAQMAREKSGQTLDATALVHEAFLRLVGPADDPHWENRGHFFAAAAVAMRRILVERARARKSLKAGGGLARVELDDVAGSEPGEELLAVDAALDRLSSLEPQAGQLVELRYFAGCTMNEAAVLLGLSLRSANRLWAYSKAWLLQELRPR